MRKIIVICSIIAAGLAASGGLYAMKASAEQKIVDGLRSNVSAQMKDPSSTQFRNEKIKDGMMCGEINSKNSYGSYVGFKRFITSSPNYAYIEGIGYVGAKDEMILSGARSVVMQRLDVEIKILDAQLLIHKNGGKFKQLTAAEMEKAVDEKLFVERWSEVCT